MCDHVGVCMWKTERCSHARERRGGQRRRKNTTKQHSRALFALRMQALIMFDVPFSHYLVCSSVVQVKSSAKDQHSKNLETQLPAQFSLKY